MQKFCSLSLCCKRPGRPYGIQFYCLLWLPRAYKNIRASFSVLLITDSWNLFKCISVISIIHWQNKYSIYFRIKESNPGPAGTYGYKMLWPSSEDIPGPSFADDILGPSPEDAWTQLYSVLQIYAWTICSDFFEDTWTHENTPGSSSALSADTMNQKVKGQSEHLTLTIFWGLKNDVTTVTL